MQTYNIKCLPLCLVSCLLLLGSCKKLLQVDPPIGTITTEEVFADNRQAEFAIAAVYSKMINGTQPTSIRNVADNNFAAGLTTIMGGFSADELLVTMSSSPEDVSILQNKILPANSRKSQALWTSAYRIIYDATAIIEGIEASTSDLLTTPVRNQLTGEALALRAFSYFYLVNFFGELPIVTTTDFHATGSLSRAPISKVYDQIKQDLLKARTLLNSDFGHADNEKIRANKWFAEALLARVYLYTGAYQEAIQSATNVINHTALFNLETDLSKVFLKNSQEAILQLKQTSEDAYLKVGTPEGLELNPVGFVANQAVYFYVNDALMNSFEADDQRKAAWTAPYNAINLPAKYRNGEGREYYTVMRLAEMYLIRAEANLRLAVPNTAAAIADMNVLRRRAGVEELNGSLPTTDALEAIAHERRVELFLEWGHRWFDLKRTGKAHEILSAMPQKQPWMGDFQLVYPIPLSELLRNGNLTQNPEYDNY